MHPVLAEIFSPQDIIIVLVVLALVFGGTRIPKLARSLGSAHSEFKKGLAEGSAGTGDADTEASPSPSAETPKQ